jgi:hypothetical protein
MSIDSQRSLLSNRSVAESLRDSASSCGATPPQFNRRDILQGLGLGSVAFSNLLANPTSAVADTAHRKPRAKNVIFLFMVGGASQLETFDPKPELHRRAGKLAGDIFSAEELAGFNPEKTFDHCRILPPIFSFKQHGQCGAWVSEIFPELSKVVDDITFIKSMRTDSPIHVVGEVLMHTGYPRKGHPSLGSWVTHGLGTENQNMPGFVVMADGRSVGGRAVYDSAYLPGVNQATLADVAAGREPLEYLKSAHDRSNQQQQIELMQRLNAIHEARHPAQSDLKARIAALETAFDMQASAPEIFDLSRESAETRQLYGDTDFGRKCLTARRLVENGVRFVEILDGAKGREWDAHGNRGGLEQNHRKNAKRTDRGIAALIQDLKRTGLLDETLVVWATEFGRTPFEEERKERSVLGRGHHHYGFTMWMAGGGLKPGISYGATDELGMHAIQNPVSHHDLHATILHLLGLDHEQLTYRHNSRDFRLTDVYGEVVHDIIA